MDAAWSSREHGCGVEPCGVEQREAGGKAWTEAQMRSCLVQAIPRQRKKHCICSLGTGMPCSCIYIYIYIYIYIGLQLPPCTDTLHAPTHLQQRVESLRTDVLDLEAALENSRTELASAQSRNVLLSERQRRAKLALEETLRVCCKLKQGSGASS
jgi:hypothetical protein